MKRGVLLFFTLFPSYFFAQGTSIDFEIRYELGKHHDPINGISLNDTGLFVGRSFYKEKLFKSGFVYETLFIPYNELDSIVLYRLKVFLELNDYLLNIKSFILEQEQPWSPPVIIIKRRGNERLLIDYMFHIKHTKERNYDRYLVNELLFLLNDLIPEKHASLRAGMPYYKPKPEDILKDIEK